MRTSSQSEPVGRPLQTALLKKHPLSPMTIYILRRIFSSLVLSLALVIVVFILLRMSIPGDPALAFAGETYSPELVERIRHELGMDKPLLVQLGLFLWDMLHGDLGFTTLRQPVTARLLEALPVTFTLALTTFVYSLSLGLPLGVAAAYWRNRWIDNLIRLLSVFSISMPTFWIGLMLMWWVSVEWGWLPVQSDGTWRSFILPTLTLGTGAAAGMGRLARAWILEILSSAHVRTARAKGLSEFWVVIRHALRNALIPVVTVAGFQIGGLLGGAVITEGIFGLSGLGTLAINAIRHRDYPLIQGTVIFACIVYLLVNLVVDVIYPIIDPRVRLS